MTRSAAMTKSAILIAAREQFARHGYHRATVRAVAAAAAIDPAMVMRYFGSKAGLFEAAVTVDLELPDLSSVPAGQVGHTLIRHFLTRWEQDDTLVILLRSEEHTSELQSRGQLVCRLLLEKKKSTHCASCSEAEHQHSYALRAWSCTVRRQRPC